MLTFERAVHRFASCWHRESCHRSGGRFIGSGGALTNIDLDNALRLESFTQNFAGTASDQTNG
jgi:hypothetical protein